MSTTRRSAATTLFALALLGAGAWLWFVHARAWGLGERSPVLNYDTAQYAVAARELSEHGVLATPFALPLELARHPRPPWPLAVVQPGLVGVEAALFKLAATMPGLARPARLDDVTLVPALLCFFAVGLLLAFAARRLLERHAAAATPLERDLAGFVVGLCFLLDPEAQHFATAGFTELPFTLGLVLALAMLAFESAPRRPLLFGLLLGVAGSFRANMLLLAPLLALAAAALAPRPRRARVLLFALVGFALPLAPWWIYKWRAFGSPGWDLTRFVVWDGVQGRSWFSLYHLPDLPALPHGAAAATLLARKAATNTSSLLLALGVGLRPLWIGALVLWLALARPPRALAVGAVAILGATLLGVLAAALTIPWTRFLFPARVPLEAAGLIALWGLLAHLGGGGASAAGRALRVLAAVLALGWGALQTSRGAAEARAASADRGVPGSATLAGLAARLDHALSAGEPVMSNLGPILAWHTRRPVLHLALAPDDLEACRRRLDFATVVLVFRGRGHAWPGWDELVERPEEALHRPEWNVTHASSWRTAQGFTVVWLELGPLSPRLAAAARSGRIR